MDELKSAGAAYGFVCFLAILMMLSVFFIPHPSKCYVMNERVRVDSVSVRLKYENLPDKNWTFYTKIGPFYSNQQSFKIGDSIDIKIVNISAK